MSAHGREADILVKLSDAEAHAHDAFAQVTALILGLPGGPLDLGQPNFDRRTAGVARIADPGAQRLGVIADEPADMGNRRD